jgi:hypothetical protein
MSEISITSSSLSINLTVSSRNKEITYSDGVHNNTLSTDSNLVNKNNILNDYSKQNNFKLNNKSGYNCNYNNIKNTGSQFIDAEYSVVMPLIDSPDSSSTNSNTYSKLASNYSLSPKPQCGTLIDIHI